ncbi:MAG: bifunctional [glutamine synthetase] adenylyltransferase/[glutamine synthetase]-adenylyl-L-tyrosine phosphorylase [Actinomycetaceae bacterium]|nr:bifunctional [glutamine synthetase] adenylyltransferase/[glutamine synthetase]-adenylyl-L-tyrosine phosphorylase [Actinomycetaceae bacterium]
MMDNLQLRRLGVRDPERVQKWLTELAPVWSDAASRSLHSAADIELALLTLLRLRDAPDLADILADPEGGARVLAVLGASQALGDHLVRHSEDLALVAKVEPFLSFSSVAEAVYEAEAESAAVTKWCERFTKPLQEAKNAAQLRRAYWTAVTLIAAADLGAPPLEAVSFAGRCLSHLVEQTLQNAVRISRTELASPTALEIGVIMLGKTGGNELNYISDVDVMYVVGGDLPENEALACGTQLAGKLAEICSGPGSEPPLWPLDTGLRPEGQDGALVRTLSSYQSYYRKWAQSWEFQALLKARPVTGLGQLGQKFSETICPLVWSAASRPDFVEDARKMRARVESNLPVKSRERNIKLGHGGLRDVEMTIQLLQLVHGQSDQSLRVAQTLQATSALVDGGYIGREAGAKMVRCYRFLRALEHRAQLYRMRRTHLLPTKETDLKRIARSLGMETACELQTQWQMVRRDIRRLHDELFYRPLLPALAGLSLDEAALAPTAASARLVAFGYKDPQGALRHLQTLTSGLSRRALLQRRILPAMIGWIANGADPDAGLLRFRRLSEEIGTSHWYLAMLRDSRVAAKDLAKLLSTSVYCADGLEQFPAAVAWLDHPVELQARSRDRLVQEMRAVASRHEDASVAFARIKAIRSRELLRTALADSLSGVEPERAHTFITPVCEAILDVSLDITRRDINQKIAIVGLGRLGGKENNYASDADIMAVGEGDGAIEQIIAQLGKPGNSWSIDMGLRPEGRGGPLLRSLDSYREYYKSWASAWEKQVLLRARFIAGDTVLGKEIMQLINQQRYTPTADGQLREIRMLKARMEAERLPRGVDPRDHIKLGPGGLSDVEWAVQMLQLKHAHALPSLQVTGTMQALRAAVKEGLLGGEEAEILATAWRLGSQIRAANVLASGRQSGGQLDLLPRRDIQKAAVALLLGFASGRELADEYHRRARHSRKIFEQVFYAK